MATPSTRPTGSDVTAFLDTVAHPGRREDGHRLRALLEEVTGEPATMWGPSIVGFGTAPLTNTSGTNDWFVVGFAPRKAATVVYGLVDDEAADPLLDELGPHTTGKSCLNIKRLDDIDLDVLTQLIRNAL